MKMKSPSSLLMLALTFLALTGSGAGYNHGEPDHGEHGAMKVRGEILDMACYIAHEAMSVNHAVCAARCIAGGQPMGLFTDDGTVYLLYASQQDRAAFEKAKEYAGQKVEVRGVAATRAHINGLEVHEVTQL